MTECYRYVMDTRAIMAALWLIPSLFLAIMAALLPIPMQDGGTLTAALWLNPIP